MEQKKIPLELIVLNEDNPRHITREKLDRLIESLLVFPKMLELRPVALDDNNIALGGNMRTRGLIEIKGYTAGQLTERMERQQKYNNMTPFEQGQLLDYWLEWQKKPLVPYVMANDLTDEERNEFIIKDNVGFGMWDYDMLANQFDETLLDEWGVDVWQAEDDNDNGSGSGDGDKKGSLQERFVVPPFSVLDTKQGYWQERKRAWLELTGDLSETRNGEFGTVGGSKDNIYTDINDGTSNFDPVLAEAMMYWFCPKGGKVLDPFGGEQTKGVVAGELGLEYEAVEFRAEQVELNNSKTEKYPNVHYTTGDSNNISKLIKKRGFNLCFTSPPYYDLEVYSKEDMSALGTYEEFMAQYENIFKQCYDMMSDNSFLVVKICEIRDKANGVYRNFVGDNITVFNRIGFKYYNEIILYNSIGTAALRANRYMHTRKVVKVHQNVLVFYKGDVKDIPQHYEDIEYEQPEENEGADA